VNCVDFLTSFSLSFFHGSQYWQLNKTLPLDIAEKRRRKTSCHLYESPLDIIQQQRLLFLTHWLIVFFVWNLISSLVKLSFILVFAVGDLFVCFSLYFSSLILKLSFVTFKLKQKQQIVKGIFLKNEKKYEKYNQN
jgi:hypothetical protein